MDLKEFAILVAALTTGLVIQSIVRLKPGWLIGISFIVILIILPLWSIGFTAGLWLACAFGTYHPQLNYQNEGTRGWVWIFVHALFTFSGFIITLLLLWKVKAYSGHTLVLQHEVGAWLYFVTLEICFYRIIALNYSVRKRYAIGYGIGFYNCLMIFYWVYPYGWKVMALTFMTFMVVSPLLLVWLDRPARPAGIPLGGDS